eukprot:TRINITY_DN3551_c0_g2_i1.p1 TRINITY_DN3551_c0_g2~~TRINITY_DN3551_c0_g2_i1.p1  ORF type:complete len:643 (-),score=86.60 TRINITY_DN3551_c0_g2_i1:185-2065(-)
MAQGIPLQKQLEELICCLHGLGKELPNCLVSLTQVVQPQIPNETRVPLLRKMFSDVPNFLSRNHQHLSQLVLTPPENELAFRLLLDLRKIQHLLSSVTNPQLLQITNRMIPPGSPQKQLEFFCQLQELFQSWTPQVLAGLNQVISDSPVHLERQHLLQLEPYIPAEIVNSIIDLIKLPLEELQSFKHWIEELPRSLIILMVNLLQMEPAVIVEIKRRLTGPFPLDFEVVDSSAAISKPDGISFISSGTKRDAFGNAKGSVTSIQPANDRAPLVSSDGVHEPALKKVNRSKHSLKDSNSSEGFNYLDSSLNLGSPLFDFDSSLNMHNETDPLLLHSPSNSSSAPEGICCFERGNNDPQTLSPTSQELVYDDTFRDDSSSLDSSSVLITPTYQVYSRNSENSLTSGFQLRIAKQPPSKTVYQRILKPFPVVMLETQPPNDSSSNYFVEASLLRSDSDVELPLCLDGNRVVRISTGVFASFKKLKILSTSQQQGTLFRLKFQLKKYVRNVFETVPVCIISNPIEVFSHTQYLSEKKKSFPPPPPNVTEIIPPYGPISGNTRVVILGSNFYNSPNLRVQFGEALVTATFHESGTLICTTPPCRDAQSPVNVRVANDGKEFCQTFATFTYS